MNKNFIDQTRGVLVRKVFKAFPAPYREPESGNLYKPCGFVNSLFFELQSLFKLFKLPPAVCGPCTQAKSDLALPGVAPHAVILNAKQLTYVGFLS